MIFLRGQLAISLVILLVGCAGKPVDEMSPDNRSAYLKKEQVKKETLFNGRRFFLINIDGDELSSSNAQEDSNDKDTYEILSGKHTIGVWAQYACMEGFFLGLGCFKYCFSGIAVNLEAGHRYEYELEKNQNEMYVNVVDETGELVSKGACEACSFLTPCSKEERTSIMERAKRESED